MAFIISKCQNQTDNNRLKNNPFLSPTSPLFAFDGQLQGRGVKYALRGQKINVHILSNKSSILAV